MAKTNSNQGGKVNPSAPQFFVDTKKSEINELKIQMQKFFTEKDIKKQMEIIKKVIAAMTIGIDVSALFNEIVKASRTQDLIIKKMIYFYLTNYARHNQESAIMAINTFLTDYKPENNFKIRGLALRTLTSLQFPDSLQYIQKCIREGLKDLDPYIRKTAVISCIKLFRLAPKLEENKDLIDTLYHLIRDTDTLVVISSINSLNEILESEGGIAISRKMIVYLLNRFKEFT